MMFYFISAIVILFLAAPAIAECYSDYRKQKKRKRQIERTLERLG